MKRDRRRAGLLTALLLVGCRAAGPSTQAEPPQPERPREEVPEPAAAAAVVGVVLPQSGSEYLQQYSELILEGVRVAVAEHEARAGARPVELVVRDGGSSSAAAAAQVVELERQGALAVLGPLLTAEVAAAAAARRDSGLALVSPTASGLPGSANVYSLNTPDVGGARALADYALSRGLRRVAVLFPASPEYRRQAEAFAAAVESGGGRVLVAVPYDSGTTTFKTPLERIAAVSPQALYVPAPERDVRQIAPQIAYYGLLDAGVQVLGGEAWTGEDLRRLVAPRYLEGLVATTPLFKPSSEVAWTEFVAAYERLYRRTLDNPYPALGYDAAKLVLSALPARGGRDELARRLADTVELRGATGRFALEGGRLVRRPFLVRIQAGELALVGGWP